MRLSMVFVVFVEVIFVCCCVCQYEFRKICFCMRFLCMKYVDEKGLHGLKSCDFVMNPCFVAFVCFVVKIFVFGHLFIFLLVMSEMFFTFATVKV